MVTDLLLNAFRTRTAAEHDCSTDGHMFFLPGTLSLLRRELKLWAEVGLFIGPSPVVQSLFNWSSWSHALPSPPFRPSDLTASAQGMLTIV